MLATDFRSSVGTPKTIYLAVDWHHNESPLGGRSAVDWLLKSAQALFAENIFSRKRAPQKTRRAIHNDSPRPESEKKANGVNQKGRRRSEGKQIWLRRQGGGPLCGGRASEATGGLQVY